MPEQHIDNEKIPTRLIGAIVAVGSLAFIGISDRNRDDRAFPRTDARIPCRHGHCAMDYHDLSVGGGRYHAHQLVFEAPIRAENHFSCGCDSGHRWLADHDRRPSFPLLIVARIIQGIGSGVATPLMINIILEQSPRSKSAD